MAVLKSLSDVIILILSGSEKDKKIKRLGLDRPHNNRQNTIHEIFCANEEFI